jgi:nucleotide-binding universal stress UspA family protein
MFKRILIPTDGTERSMRAVHEGVAFAREASASVVGFYAPEDYRIFLANEYLPPALMPEQEYKSKLGRAARANLEPIAREAACAGVPFEGYAESAQTPWAAIVRAAQDKGCDLIFMTSHGRTGLAALVKGSQAYEVMAHSRIPVLVWRE